MYFQVAVMRAATSEVDALERGAIAGTDLHQRDLCAVEN